MATSPVHGEWRLESIHGAEPDLKAIVAAFLRDNGLPGASVGLLLDSKLVWANGAGSPERGTKRRPDDRTLYRIASITKTFTASAVMALRDVGALGLDDPMVQHLPEFARVHNPFGSIASITVRQMLRHTSGLQGEVPSTDPRVRALLRPRELLESLPAAAIVIPPDSAHKYSNLGYELLGELVGRVSGRAWETYVREVILEPLGMTDTVTDPANRSDRVAVGYNRRMAGAPLRRARILRPDETGGSAGLWSTVADLARWLSFQLRTDPWLARGGEQVLSGATVAEMHRPAIISKPDLTTAQGIGWRVVRRNDTVIVGHGGFLQGFMSRIDAVPSARVGSIVLLNGVGDPGSAADLSSALLDRVLPSIQATRADGGPDVDAPSAEAIPGRWAELVGTYLDRDFGNRARVDVQGDELVFIDVDENEPRPVRPTEDPDRFTFIEGRPAGEPLRFLRDADGRIDGLNAAGYPMVRQPTNGVGT